MPTPKPSDTVAAMLTPGEAVLNKEAAELVGRDAIAQANQKGLEMRNQIQGYADGTEQVPFNQLGATTSPQTPPSPQHAASLATSEAMRSGTAKAFEAQTGYRPGSAIESGATSAPIAPASLTGGAQRSGADITKPVEVGVSKPDFSTGSAMLGNTKVNKVGTSYSQGSLANMSGVKSAVGSVTQPISTGIMRGMPGITPGATGNNDQAKANLFASTPPIPGMANNPYSFAKKAQPAAPQQNIQNVTEAMPSDEELLNLPGEYEVQGYADGTEKVEKENKALTDAASFGVGAAGGAALAKKMFGSGNAPEPAQITQQAGTVPARTGIVPTAAEASTATGGYKPNFQTVGGPYTKSSSTAMVPYEAEPTIKGVRAVKPEVEGIVGRALQNSKAGLKPLLQAAGQAAVPVIEGASTVRDATTPGMKAEDVAGRVGEAGTRGAGALIGAEGGAALGAFGGPAAPITVPLGAAVGGALGYAAPDIANKIQERVTGNKYELPSDKARRLREEGVVPKANIEPFTPTEVVPQRVENTIPTGLEAREGPNIDFSNPSVEATAGPAQNGDANFGKVTQGNGQTRVELPDSKSYIQSGNQAAMDRVYKGLKERGGIVSPPPQQSAAAQQAGTTDFWLNRGYPGGAQQYMAEQKRKGLEDIALNGGVNGRTNVAEIGATKRRQAAAQGLLEQQDKNAATQQQSALESKKMDITAENTAAVNKQNAIHQSAQDARDTERNNLMAEQNATAKQELSRKEKADENKPVKVEYGGEKLEGPKTVVAKRMRDIDRTQAAKAWQEKNSQGIMESDEEYRGKMQRFLNANMPPVDPSTGKEIEIRYDQAGNPWMAGPNGKAVPYVAE
jgi:hypothetical protein